MKNILTKRIHFFLAKIAGRNVSESTLTPPVVTNMEEKLLDEIAERFDDVARQSSIGGDKYVVTITHNDSGYSCDKTLVEIKEAISKDIPIKVVLPDSLGWVADNTASDSVVLMGIEDTGGNPVLYAYTISASGVTAVITSLTNVNLATPTNAGIVKQAENVAEAAGSAPTAAEFKALLDALIAAGIMAAPALVPAADS